MTGFILYKTNIYLSSNNNKVFMDTTNALEIKEKTCNLRLSWQDSPPLQRLLDVIAGIIAKEYVQVAKQNPAVFSAQGTKI